MAETHGTSIGAHFAALTDPRTDRGQDHLLLDMVAVEPFGRAKVAWLRNLRIPGE